MSEWVFVVGRLPELNQPVLVIPKDWPSHVWAACRIDEGDGWMWAQYVSGPLDDPKSYECDDDYQYTHWMPLPAALNNPLDEVEKK